MDDIVKAFKKLDTSTISDALDKLGINGTSPGRSLSSIIRGASIARYGAIL